MPAAVRLAVAGAGLIGRRHAAAIDMAAGAALACIVDPAEAGASVANAHGVPCHPSLDAMIDAGGVDGVILATPNALHVEGALACIAARLPVLVEKPIATEPAGGRSIVKAGEAARIAIAIGHHRRHNPLIARAKLLIDQGRLGRIASVRGSAWLMKPDDYFEAAWRRRKGAGPVYLNLIHGIDLLQHLVGAIRTVHAMESNAIRGNEVEDTAVVLLRFEDGALGTVNVCDSAVAPWSWELTARENPAYPATSEACYWIGGTEGSLSLPHLTLWSTAGVRSWWEPISATQFPFEFTDPLVLQVEQFAAVVRGEAEPLVTGRDGLAALEVIEAVKRAAACGRPVEVGGET